MRSKAAFLAVSLMLVLSTVGVASAEPEKPVTRQAQQEETTENRNDFDEWGLLGLLGLAGLAGLRKRPSTYDSASRRTT